MPHSFPDPAKPEQSHRPTDTTDIGAADTGAAALTIRPLASLSDYHACVALQDQVWGPGYSEIVPASLLQVAQHVGGLAIGAFTPGNELVGFVFGLTGVHDGEIVHWSHLLGVSESVRNAGVGRVLKEYQRAELARLGIAEMRWTFDPLVGKNAHLNLNRLGAHVVEYVRNMYGTTGSPLHAKVTDRFVVACPTHGVPREPSASPLASTAAPILTPNPHPGDGLLSDASEHPAAVWIEIPADIQQVVKRSPVEAESWRSATRKHFEWALASGYTITGLHRDPMTSRSFYTLELNASSPGSHA